MSDTVFLPKKDLQMALDILASESADLPLSVAMNDSPIYNQLLSLYTVNGVESKFSQLILSLALNEGMRQVMKNQPLHSRMIASQKDSL
jgi:hypothetical protein